MCARSIWPGPKLPGERAEEMLEKGPPPDTDAYLAMEAALSAPTCAWKQPTAMAGRTVRRDHGGLDGRTLSNLWLFFPKSWALTWAPCISRVAEGEQIVLQEPTVAAIVVEEQKMVAWGQEAQDMLGKVPEFAGSHPPADQRRDRRL